MAESLTMTVLLSQVGLFLREHRPRYLSVLGVVTLALVRGRFPTGIRAFQRHIIQHTRASSICIAHSSSIAYKSITAAVYILVTGRLINCSPHLFLESECSRYIEEPSCFPSNLLLTYRVKSLLRPFATFCLTTGCGNYTATWADKTP